MNISVHCDTKGGGSGRFAGRVSKLIGVAVVFLDVSGLLNPKTS